jgi:hypothetical protein
LAVQEGNEKEQVIKELEKQIRLTESVNSGWVHLTIEKAKKALELLKEQEKIVLCKDCKHFKDNRCLNDNVHYSIDDCGCQPTFHVTDDWFCAEGERRLN